MITQAVAPKENPYDETLTLEQASGYLRNLLKEFPFSDWKEEPQGAPALVGDGTFDLVGIPVQEYEPGVEGPGEVAIDPKAKIRQSRSQAVQIAAMLSQFAMGIVGRASPRMGFIYNANASRSGKTLLAKIATIPVNGSMRTQAWNPKDEELRKVLDAEALRASKYIVFDNARGHLSSPVLEGLMTASVWGGRVLGATKLFEASWCATVFITGNDCTVSSDLMNRCLLVDLFVNEADVQQRKVEDEFDDAWLMRRDVRIQMLSCLWAICRHWNEAGRPIWKGLRPRRGFEHWCRVIGSMVAFAGFGDCLAEPENLESAGDTEGMDMKALVTLLAEYFTEARSVVEFTFQEIVKEAREAGLFEWILSHGSEREVDGGKGVGTERGRSEPIWQAAEALCAAEGRARVPARYDVLRRNELHREG